MPSNDYTIASSSFDTAATPDTTRVVVEEEIEHTGVSGDLKSVQHLTPTARAMHISGGVMYWGNVKWPTRFPSVAYTESGNYDIRLQNEYASSSITVRGPYKELTGVGKVICAWHLETALHVYVKVSGSWKHYKRLTPSEQGQYTVQGSNFESLYAFSEERFNADQVISGEAVPPGATYIEEQEVVVSSRINRPLEVTSNGFGLSGDEQVRSITSARLSEEEGLRAYQFYIGTSQAVYVGQPNTGDETVSTDIVTNEYGVGLGFFNQPIHTSAPMSALILDTEGVIRLLRGRQEQRLFPEGSAPWSTVHDIEFDTTRNELAIATDEGLWGYDWQRNGIFRQYDVFDPKALAYDRDDGTILGWDDGASKWKRFDESGEALEPQVTTQMIESGGRELEIIWAKSDYDTTDYDNTDNSTFAELWHTVRSDEVMGYDENPDSIQGNPTTTNTESQGATTIEITTDSDDTVSLSGGDRIWFTNHDTIYTIASNGGASISASSSGTVTLENGLTEQVPSGTRIRPPYRGIYKLPRRERVRPHFRGIGHQVRIRKFDSLRDLQLRVDSRISYE